MAGTATARSALLIFGALLAAVPATRAGGPAADGGRSPRRPVVAADPASSLGQAFRAYDQGDIEGAWRSLGTIAQGRLLNRDYYLWLRGQVALLRGEPQVAMAAFADLSRQRDSRFATGAAWRIADCRWELGQRAQAAKAYQGLITQDGAARHGDVGTARFRIAVAARSRAETIARLRAFLLDHPGHPLGDDAEARLIALGGAAAARLAPADRIERAANLTAAHLWDEAVAELALVPDDVDVAMKRRRDYWLGTTLFKMRRRYQDAGELLLAVYPHMGAAAAEAMFHGARALSRADRDDDAIGWYRKVVAQYPTTDWAEEAQYLSGWLEFNRGNWKAAVAPLEESLRRYPRSKWADDAQWFLAMSYYFLGDWAEAIPRLEAQGKRSGALEAGRARYWHARALDHQGDATAAVEIYRSIVTRWPFSWYALLSRSRLAERGLTIGPFGDPAPAPAGPEIAAAPDPKLTDDPLLRAADELVRAGLGAEAGEELERGERAFLARHDRAQAYATLLDAYRRAGNYSRPWMLAVVYGGAALDGPAEGTARTWWEHAYPRAYRELVTQWQHLGDNPEGYLYAIMRKESGFDPHVLSYADAQGLLQMIPATTERVAQTLKLEYAPGDLYDPEFNIRTGSWYIGRLLAKFKGQIPIGAGSFNSGPRPVMRWLDAYGDRPIDELVELVSYTQTREYMKKVTENYARYRYLYQGEIYVQPLVVDRHYRVDEITY